MCKREKIDTKQGQLCFKRVLQVPKCAVKKSSSHFLAQAHQF